MISSAEYIDSSSLKSVSKSNIYNKSVWGRKFSYLPFYIKVMAIIFVLVHVGKVISYKRFLNAFMRSFFFLLKKPIYKSGSINECKCVWSVFTFFLSWILYAIEIQSVDEHAYALSVHTSKLPPYRNGQTVRWTEMSVWHPIESVPSRLWPLTNFQTNRK